MLRVALTIAIAVVGILGTILFVYGTVWTDRPDPHFFATRLEGASSPFAPDPGRLRSECPNVATALDEAATSGNATLASPHDPWAEFHCLEAEAARQGFRDLNASPVSGKVAWGGSVLFVGVQPH